MSPKFRLSDEIILQSAFSADISESLTWGSSLSGWTSDKVCAWLSSISGWICDEEHASKESKNKRVIVKK